MAIGSLLIRYLTIDSQPLVHNGVRHMLDAFGDLQPVGEAFDLDDALRLGARCAPDVALVEIADLGPDWAGGLRRVARGMPKARLVVFTATVNATQAREALRAGVSGYLLKRVHAMTLAQALRSVYAGQQVFAPEASSALMEAHLADEPRHDDFSRREREVLALLARGLSNTAIAARLCVSTATVKFHCGNIYRKLGVESRSEALVRAYEHGLVPRLVARAAHQAQDHEWPGAPALARRA